MLDEVLDEVGLDLVVDGVDLVGGDQGGVEHELEVDGRQTLQFVQVEQVEQETHRVVELSVREERHARKQLQGVDEAVVVRVPDHEGTLVGVEYLLELDQVDGEVVAEGLEGGVVVAEFAEGG